MRAGAVMSHRTRRPCAGCCREWTVTHWTPRSRRGCTTTSPTSAIRSRRWQWTASRCAALTRVPEATRGCICSQRSGTAGHGRRAAAGVLHWRGGGRVRAVARPDRPGRGGGHRGMPCTPSVSMPATCTGAARTTCSPSPPGGRCSTRNWMRCPGTRSPPCGSPNHRSLPRRHRTRMQRIRIRQSMWRPQFSGDRRHRRSQAAQRPLRSGSPLRSRKLNWKRVLSRTPVATTVHRPAGAHV
jgi:hypothetical protein